MSSITKIIIHCAATPNGKRLARQGRNAADIIDQWHQQRGFQREINARIYFNRHLQAIGYHFIIDTDGTITTGRHPMETGAHCKGQNRNSIGICLVGTDKFTLSQWRHLQALIQQLAKQHPNATLHGHREFANKICPGFNVSEWIDNSCQPLVDHLIQEGIND